MTRLPALLLAGILASTSAALGAPAEGSAGGGQEERGVADLRKLFTLEADLFLEAGGLSRLVLPPEVLAACRADLSDLRVFDASEKEVPYLVDSGLKPTEGIEVKRTFEPRILDVRREALERQDRPPRHVEAYLISAPPSAPETGAWDLVFEVGRPRFIRVVTIEAPGGVLGAEQGGPSEGATASLVERATIFRLGRGYEKTRLTLPAFSEEGLSVTIEGEEEAYLEPRFRFESARFLGGEERAAVSLAEISRHSARGRTSVVVARPEGLVPDVLRVETATPFFDRTFDVWDEGPVRDEGLLGRAKLFRVQGTVPIESLEIELRAARGDRLRVEVDDGDSPPLESPAFSAIVRQPSLVFAADGGGGGADAAAGKLRFGGGRAWRPRYDLAGFLPAAGRRLGGKRASAAQRLYDPAETGSARLGPVRPNPLADDTPVLAFAMRAGAEIDPRPYSHRRGLTLIPSREGLARVRLEPADLALARADLADVRVVGEKGRQWPYLLEHEADEAWLNLGAPAPASKEGTSVYPIELPVTPIEIADVVLETDEPFFDRAFEARGALPWAKKDDPKRKLATGRIARRTGDPRSLTIPLARERIGSLEIAVVDGDDAPLRFRAVRARVPLPVLFLAAPRGRYALLIGNPEASPPRYELAHVRDVVLAVESRLAEAEAVEGNPRHRKPSRLARGPGAQRLVVWAVLVVAVLVLGGLTLRLARKESAPPAGRHTS